MKTFIFITILLLCGCSNEELEKIKRQNAEYKDNITALEKENEELKGNLKTYQGFFTSKKVAVLTDLETEECKKLAASYFVGDVAYKDRSEAQFYFKVCKSLAASCAALNYDLSSLGKNETIKEAEQIVGRSAHLKVKNLISVIRIVYPKDISNYDLLVCSDIILSGIVKYKPNAKEKDVTRFLDRWVDATSAFQKNKFDFISSVKLGSMAVYFNSLLK